MTDLSSLDRLLERFPEQEHSSLPWRWEVNRKGTTVRLCGGRPTFDATVMDFVRWGMSGAAPRFMSKPSTEPMMGGLMQRCDEMAATVEGREHHADWFATIKNPDAEYLVTAANAYPELRSALVALREQHDALRKKMIEAAVRLTICRDRMAGCREEHDGTTHDLMDEVEAFADDALVAAETLCGFVGDSKATRSASTKRRGRAR